MSLIAALALFVGAAPGAAGACDPGSEDQICAPERFAAPVPETKILDGGAQAVIWPLGGAPWVEWALVFRIDPDPAGRSGLAAVAALLVEDALAARGSASGRGSGLRAGQGRGGFSSVEAQRGALVIRGGATPAQLDDVARGVVEALTSLSPNSSALESAVARALRAREALRQDDLQLAALVLRRALLAGHPSGHARAGEPRELAAITTDDATSFLRRFVRADRAQWIFAGAVTSADLARAARWSKKLPAGAPRSTPLAVALPPPAKGIRIIVVDKPARAHATILIGRALAADENATRALRVASTILGGTLSSPLARALADPHALGRGRTFLDESTSPSLAATLIVAAPEHAAAAIARARSVEAKWAGTSSPLTRTSTTAVGAEPPQAARTLGRRAAEAVERSALADAEHCVNATVHAFARGHFATDVRAAPEAIAAVSDADLSSAFAAWIGTDPVIVVVVSATARLQKELVGIPGVREVAVIAYDQQ